MILFIAGFNIDVLAAEQKVFVLTLNYDSGAVTLNNLILTVGIFNEPVVSEGNYSLEILSFDGSILYSEKFDFDFRIFSTALPEWFDENGTQIYFPTQEETRTILNQTTKELIIPYFSNAKTINVYHQTEKILEIPVAHFANVCGDNICQPHESYESCKLDCPSGGKDDYCDAVQDNICDPDCIADQDQDCKLINLPIILVGGMAILSIAIVVLFKFRKNKSSYEKLKEKWGK